LLDFNSALVAERGLKTVVTKFNSGNAKSYVICIKHIEGYNSS